MAGVHRQLAAAARNGLIRPGPDADYADGDDATWMGVDWRSLTRTLDLDGRAVNVVDTGTRTPSGSGTGGGGPPLLWIHGLGGMWQNWLLNLPAFMGRYRCIAPDLPGFGGSELPAGEISIQGYARTIDRICGELGVEDPVVIGNSMGGFVGAELAISEPTRVAKLVLVSAAGLSTEYHRTEPLMLGAGVWAFVTARTGVRADPVVRRRRLRRLLLQGVVRYPERLSAPLTWELVQGAPARGLVPGLRACLEYSFRDRLGRIDMPTLIVWGRNDMLVPVGDAARYQRLIGANARKVVFKDTGHVPMLERPSRFNALLERFLSGEPAPERAVEGVSA